MKKNHPNLIKFLEILHLLLGILIVLAGLIWIYIIVLGYSELNRMPKYEDSRVAFSNSIGIDYEIVIYALVFAVYGIGFWILQTIIISALKLYRLKRTTIIIGLIGIILWLFLLTSSQFDWILD